MVYSMLPVSWSLSNLRIDFLIIGGKFIISYRLHDQHCFNLSVVNYFNDVVAFQNLLSYSCQIGQGLVASHLCQTILKTCTCACIL